MPPASWQLDLKAAIKKDFIIGKYMSVLFESIPWLSRCKRVRSTNSFCQELLLPQSPLATFKDISGYFQRYQPYPIQK